MKGICERPEHNSSVNEDDSDNILENILNHEILDIEEFLTDYKALSITIELKEKLFYKKKELFDKIKVESKLKAEYWETIALKVEERLLELEEDHINRAEMWAHFTEIYDEEKRNRIGEVKEKKNQEKQQKKNIEIDKETDENKLLRLILEHEKLEKIFNIEHEIKKLIDKKDGGQEEIMSKQ
ncbi:hypothetical protein C1646_771495 [Rhizophagus diaphanus]|nr:hypothetical protein C1646_771495 [Rhizophagus diaphanus] [Rhizophagus sp. MUCL 43196]